MNSKRFKKYVRKEMRPGETYMQALARIRDREPKLTQEHIAETAELRSTAGVMLFPDDDGNLVMVDGRGARHVPWPEDDEP